MVAPCCHAPEKVGGVIDVGARTRQDITEKPTHMDMVNSIAFWCVAKTRLEDFIERPGSPSSGERVIPTAEADLLFREVCARIADWSAGLEALKTRPELYDAFIKGSLAMSGTYRLRLHTLKYRIGSFFDGRGNVERGEGEWEGESR
jgi:hypothetical protein